MVITLKFSDVLTVTVQAILCLLLLKVLRAWWKWSTWKSKIEKIPGPITRFLVGNLPIQFLYYNLNFSPSVLLHCYTLGYTVLYRKERLLRAWIGIRPYVLFYDAAAVEALLSSTTELDKTFEYNFLHDWLGTGLLTSTGRKWKSRRRMLTPSFHFRILDHFQEVFQEQSNVFVQNVKQLSKDGKTLDVSPLVTSLALDIICETAMGTKLGAQESQHSDYAEAIHTLGTIFIERILRPPLWPGFIFKMTPPGREFFKNLKVLHDFTDKVIRERKTESVEITAESGSRRRLVFLDILLQEQKNSGLTDMDIREEVDTFMFEGHDTTSVGISWALFLIGNHPEVQRKIQDELDSIFGGDLNAPITSKEIKDMKYLECTLKECQRLYPSVPLIGRYLKQDLQVGKFLVPAETTCVVFPPALHLDPEVFPEPEVFNPDRFLPENCSGRHPYAYVPFSAGPRNCIGQRFALNEEKTVVAQCLRHFTLQSQDHPDKIPVKPELVSRPNQPLLVRFIERKDIIRD